MKKRVFSGARPTGRQHIGNYLGAIQNYVALQEEYDCVYSVVDIHALTTLEETARLQGNVKELVLDWLAAGLDPKKSTIFVQSHVPEIAELTVYLGMMTPFSWLMRVPTFKEKARLQPHNINYGLVGYPVLMAADIMLYKAEVVPVGEDQLPHLELTREIVRRFNHMFGETFPEPKAKMTKLPLVVGLDGKEKMSKQLDNHIELALTAEETQKRVMTAVTDPARKFKKDPGHPEVCNVYRMQTQFNPSVTADIEERCRKAEIGCVECKRMLAEAINEKFAPLRERRKELEGNEDYIKEILKDGAERASVIARQTLTEVKQKMGLL